MLILYEYLQLFLQFINNPKHFTCLQCFDILLQNHSDIIGTLTDD